MIRQERIDFIGIGVGRSGTTWLATCLNEHPQILMSTRKSAKELRYFDFQPRFNLGSGWYFDQFPPFQLGKIRGEFSPFYYMNPYSAERIAALLPDVKILVILRNPIDVVNSYFWYHRRAPWEKLDANSLTEMLSRDDAGALIELGYYYKHLTRFYERFPREQIYVIIYEELLDNPSFAVRDVFRFLDVQADFIPGSLHARVNELSTLLDGSSGRLARWCSIMIMGLLRNAVIESPKLEARLHRLYRRIFSDCRMVVPACDNIDRQRLAQIFRADSLLLQDLVKKDLSNWWGEADSAGRLYSQDRSTC